MKKYEIDKLDIIPAALQNIKNPPKTLYYIGNNELLKRKKIAIIGSRKPISYTKEITFKIARYISEVSGVVVSGAAMGTDAIAHKGAGNNTIAVMGNSLDIIYPKVNRVLIDHIYDNSLALSEYKPVYEAKPYSFVLRNRIVVGLSDAVVITQADLNSGSMRSAEIALEQKKKIYVLPHRYGDSEGTNQLVKEKKAEVIYDIDEFINKLGFKTEESKSDEILDYLKQYPDYNDAVQRYSEKIFEYELEGKIVVENGRIRVI